MVELDMSVRSDGCRLVGTLCLPDEHAGHLRDPRSEGWPTVLMLHGSGALDRNENLHGQALNAFNALAHYLASRGIASLRYDKRGCGESTGDYFATGHHNLVDDAGAWVAALKDHYGCDSSRLFLLGHSEGTAIAPQVYLRHPEVAGLVLLCPFVENLESVLMRQAQLVQAELASRPGLLGVLPNWFFRRLGADVRAQQRLIQKIRNSRRDWIRVRLQKVPARWYRELFALDLPAIYQQVRCPTLVLGGEKDVQCNPEDVAVIESLIPGAVTAELVPDLTHLLRLEAGPPSLIGSRELLRQPLEPVVMEAVTIWLKDQVTFKL